MITLGWVWKNSKFVQTEENNDMNTINEIILTDLNAGLI